MLADDDQPVGRPGQTEQEHRLSFLREPDAGLRVDRARLGAGAPPLEAVLATGLTPGDFVRAVKQLIDLLDQVGAAAGGVAAAGVAATARKAIDALRRGIVAYSSVG